MWGSNPVVPFSFPGSNAPGIGFRNQCEHWLRKQYLRSGGRPEIPENFRLPQSFPSQSHTAQPDAIAHHTSSFSAPFPTSETDGFAESSRLVSWTT
jgi:hypothetical protein